MQGLDLTWIQLATDPTCHGSHSPRIPLATDPTHHGSHSPGSHSPQARRNPRLHAGRPRFLSWDPPHIPQSWQQPAACESSAAASRVRQLESNRMPRQLESKVGRASAGIEPHAASAGIEGWTCVSWNRRLDLLGAILPRPPVRHAALTLLPQPPTTGPCHHGSLLPRLSHHGSLPHVQLVASSHSLLSQPPITASYHGFHP